MQLLKILTISLVTAVVSLVISATSLYVWKYVVGLESGWWSHVAQFLTCGAAGIFVIRPLWDNFDEHHSHQSPTPKNNNL